MGSSSDSSTPRGEAWVWFSGLGLIIGLGMVIGLLSLVLLNGAAVFWAPPVPVAQVDDTLRQLVADMLETMYDANGVGLAAPQVGVALRLAVIDVSHDPECITFLKVAGRDSPLASIMPLVFVNPELEFTGPKERDTEGCLSIQDVRAEVSRPGALKAKLQQLDGSLLEIETDGLLARAIQHEIGAFG